MSDGRKRIAVALDASERSRILELARLVGPEIGVLKVGLEAFCAHGPELVREVAELAPVFLDLKLHDIPNTVGGAAAAAARTGASILNVHAGGGLEMMRAAGERAREAAAAAGLPVPRVIAVTVLTSLDAPALSAVGLARSPREAALRLALLARQAGLDGVVCSPEEIETIRSACGPEFLLVVPGIRPAGSAAGDQKRIATPGAAARAGADLLVIGRPITGAPDPAAAARAIAAEIGSA
ncbi:MAG TPA: orotidine-5'-phosphate decarboxylase [Thermoanaerobaculia bacterium]|nr:orotidine-5'-phosphate decarboxylase [Thermoanaerobaculia bacterium]